ncbi:NTP transferase domain-containing protein [Leptospira levettii]|uniref:NTP transferase domain-containing protein n=1 Tax=Leptospira levettii TaxID=2023178 RepID=UPI000C2A2F69|nr:sugar phosphate nucleotidyltransferase [Leptospira levettii]MCW7472076.1 NTP transferase domain-containing protein [Leptospira levettii]PJZ89438.1 hypothetical protein CH368_06655 [Leptospira levettii]
MHIIIPMSGIGKRFLKAGYTRPKPLIEVDGKPIIAHVIEMFPGETKFTFICNEEHLKTTDMRSVLLGLIPDASIRSIPPHKLGPVFAVMKIFDEIDDKDEVIINYCDFGKDWNYQEFLRDLRENHADGGISAYKGFHPHMLGKINYAFMKEEDRWMVAIQEKKPFTEFRMNEYASDGTYYFRTGKICKQYFQRTYDKGIDLNGEFYVSVVYNLLVEDGLKVRIFEIEHMLQWGTPGELEEYLYWSNIFKGLTKPKISQSPIPKQVNVIPMAGMGSRFSKEGYTTPKPILPIDGIPMVVHAANSLPNAETVLFIAQSIHCQNYPIEREIQKHLSNAKIIQIPNLTEGQAITVNLGLEDLPDSSSLMIAASDNGMLYDLEKLHRLMQDDTIDGIVFTFSGNPTSEIHPEMYGWVKQENNVVQSVSVKKPISDTPIKDQAIVGAFYFRSIRIFKVILDNLIQRNLRINNEFYVDSMVGLGVEMGYKFVCFPIDHYICWGTPDDYKTFLYWQELFDKVDWHPYKRP